MEKASCGVFHGPKLLCGDMLSFELMESGDLIR